MNDKKEIDEIIDKAGELAKTTQPLRRMKVQSGDISLELEWPQAATNDGSSAIAGPAAGPAAGSQAPAPGSEADAADGADDSADDSADDGRVHICAPLVGTFYHAPKPGDPAFVRPGDPIEAGQQVGILEAMKLMNPIEAEEPGVVAEILVSNGTPVEYGEPLIALTGQDR